MQRDSGKRSMWVFARLFYFSGSSSFFFTSHIIFFSCFFFFCIKIFILGMIPLPLDPPHCVHVCVCVSLERQRERKRGRPPTVCFFFLLFGLTLIQGFSPPPLFPPPHKNSPPPLPPPKKGHFITHTHTHTHDGLEKTEVLYTTTTTN